MKKSYRISLMTAMTLLVGIMIICPAITGAEEAKTDKTLENLQTAYNGESNANAKYLAYAQKADEEGYHKVARLFRAAASAEEVHLKNHAKVIEKMGATPMADINLPMVKSTKENLEDAIKGETYEQTTMYPDFIKQAEKEGNADAVQTFTFARDAEAEHAKLYNKALTNLDNWKTADAYFYVCPTCGYTVENQPDFKICPVCGMPESDYLVIS